METAQYLFPFDTLVLSGPNPPHDGVCDPTQQDDKTNLQQQTILDFQASDTYLMRGWVRTGAIPVPFLKASYRAGPTRDWPRPRGISSARRSSFG